LTQWKERRLCINFYSKSTPIAQNLATGVINLRKGISNFTVSLNAGRIYITAAQSTSKQALAVDYLPVVANGGL